MSSIRGILDELDKAVCGQVDIKLKLLAAVIAKGHVLLEGVPGVGKTLLVRALAGAFGGDFKRIQFTPDLLPADLIGTEIYRPHSGAFEIRFGPLFANLILADEINRAPAKVQSALLEAMQEGRITVGDKTYSLPQPFFVVATQNPIEHEGTYPLPEAELDRFMMKLDVGYTSYEDELKILDGVETDTIHSVLSSQELSTLQSFSEKVHVDDRIKKYIVDILRATRNSPKILIGASPRSGKLYLRVAKAFSLVRDEGFVTPTAIKELAQDVLSHRIVLKSINDNPRAVIQEIINSVPIP